MSCKVDGIQRSVESNRFEGGFARTISDVRGHGEDRLGKEGYRSS